MRPSAPQVQHTPAIGVVDRPVGRLRVVDRGRMPGTGPDPPDVIVVVVEKADALVEAVADPVAEPVRNLEAVAETVGDGP